MYKRQALDFALKAQDEGLDAYLMTVVEGRFAAFYKRLADYFPQGKDAVFSMIAPDAMADYRARVAALGGTVSLSGTPVSYTHLDVYKRQVLPLRVL